MDDIAAVEGSKLTWIASVLAFKAVVLGCSSVVRREEAGVICLVSDADVVHYHQQAGRGKMSLFLKWRDRVYPMYYAPVYVKPCFCHFSWFYRTWDCTRRVADPVTILRHKARDYMY